MRAVVFHGVGDIRLETVPDPKIQEPTDAIVRLTTSAICGTDLHMVRGTLPGMVPGTIFGHEGVGVVEEVGASVRAFKAGDRVVVPSTVCCGACPYCEAGHQSQCDNANPNGKQAGTVFFGGPKTTGPVNGLQAEYARIPLADSTLVKLPPELSDAQAITLSDIFPTGYFGADIAGIAPGDSVAVFGCGPVGLFAIISARLLGAGRVFAVDTLPDRLEKARGLGAEPIDFNAEHPVERLRDATDGDGVLRAIDAVGVDAYRPERGPAHAEVRAMKSQFKEERKEIQLDGSGATWGGHWVPGDSPSLALTWAVQALAKVGTLSIIGVYPETMTRFPIGSAMMKNLAIRMGNVPHRHYIPRLIDIVREGKVDPLPVLTEVEPMAEVIAAFQNFDERKSGWIKIALDPAKSA